MKTRVALLLQDLYYGGTQRHALSLAKGLDPSRFDTEIWVLKGRGGFEEQARGYGIRLRWFGRGRFVWVWVLFRLFFHLRTRPVDVLVLYTGIPNFWARLFARAVGIPVVISTWRGAVTFAQRLERWIHPYADHFITNADAKKRVLAERFGVPAGRITVIKNGLDTARFSPPPGGASSRDDRLIINVARFVREKDHGTLLKAFAIVSRKFRDVRLRLLGEGPLRGWIKRATQRLGIQESVEILEAGPGVVSHLHQASLFVLSSLVEGMPNAVLEAMGCGLPVVAVDVDGVAEVVADGETGIVVAPGDYRAMAGAMEKFLNNPGLGRCFGERGRLRVTEHFSLDRMLNRHAELFERLLKSGSD